MSSQQQQSESREFSPSQLNRAIAILHTVLCAAVFASSVGTAITFSMQTPEESLSKLFRFVAIVWAFGTLLLLIGCVRNLRRPTLKVERILSWMMLLYFGLLSLALGQVLFDPPGYDWQAALVTLFFETMLMGFFSAIARIFSLPPPGQKQSEQGD